MYIGVAIGIRFLVVQLNDIKRGQAQFGHLVGIGKGGENVVYTSAPFRLIGVEFSGNEGLFYACLFQRLGGFIRAGQTAAYAPPAVHNDRLLAIEAQKSGFPVDLTGGKQFA